MKSFQPHAFGKYFLVEKISSGGMGEIFRAKTFGINGFEKQFAIKCILPQLSENQNFTRMLIDEAKLSVLLNHTNIVQVYDLGKVEEEYFISMEYVNGVDLRHILIAYENIQQTIPEDIVIYIMSEVCRGLDYAHAKKNKEGKALGSIHRDISPPNILISFEGEIKIVDFGIAKVEQNTHHTQTGLLKGKIPYMSPEQARGKKLDHRSDIFACGLLLFEMLTGHKLFTGDDYIQVLLKIRDTPVSADLLPPSISDELKQILLKALTHSRKERYPNAGKFQIDLIHYLHAKYPDFTPQSLTDWIQNLFAQKIEERARLENTEIPLDQNTYETLIQAKQEEYLVHREDSKKQSNPLIDPNITSDFQISGSIKNILSYLSQHRTDFLLGGFLLLALGFFSLYKFHFSNPTTEVASEKLPIHSNPAPTLGSLQISTLPPGAKIFINGRDTTRTSPYAFHDFKIGETYILTLTLPNYQDIVRPLQLKDANFMHISENFTPLRTATLPTPPAQATTRPSITHSPKKAVSAKKPTNSKVISEQATPANTQENGKNSDSTMVKGFKKAGSAIKNFFGGGKSKAQPESSSSH